MSNDKQPMVQIGSYLLAKNGTTKYLKLEAKPNADEATKKLVADLVKALGSDVIYVNIHDADFKAKYNVPDFVKGRISVPAPGKSAVASNTDSEVNF